MQNKNNNFVIGIIFVLIAALLVFIAYSIATNDNFDKNSNSSVGEQNQNQGINLDTSDNTATSYTISGSADADVLTSTVEGFKAEALYQGNNLWKYTITGTLSNPCYKTEVEALVAESFPEQVTIMLNLISPDPDIICIQSLKEISLNGEYNASENATMRLVVK